MVPVAIVRGVYVRAVAPGIKVPPSALTVFEYHWYDTAPVPPKMPGLRVLGVPPKQTVSFAIACKETVGKPTTITSAVALVDAAQPEPDKATWQ